MTRSNTKMMIANARCHKISNMYDIDDAYSNCSHAKRNAWEYCKKLCADYDGWDLRIISKNTFAFSAGFYFISKETGCICFAYITKDYDRYADRADAIMAV